VLEHASMDHFHMKDFQHEQKSSIPPEGSDYSPVGEDYRT
jgi:hypothetical protein